MRPTPVEPRDIDYNGAANDRGRGPIASGYSPGGRASCDIGDASLVGDPTNIYRGRAAELLRRVVAESRGRRCEVLFA